jgi:hypothetical protein
MIYKLTSLDASILSIGVPFGLPGRGREGPFGDKHVSMDKGCSSEVTTFV